MADRYSAVSPFVPFALACGHYAQGVQEFDYDPVRDEADRTLIVCPEGCGLQRFVAEPNFKEEAVAS